mgnify:CR=1
MRYALFAILLVLLILIFLMAGSDEIHHALKMHAHWVLGHCDR